jgi:PEGA domain
MEYLIVNYPVNRDVNLDGALLGKTNKKLRVQAGAHTVTLAGPLDYSPPSQDIDIADTTPSQPMEVDFAPN